VSARASHLVVRKNRLMTYEVELSGQATIGISPDVTNVLKGNQCLQRQRSSA
jgi:hypothetical protein